MAKSFHPLLAQITSGIDRELAKYVEFLKKENKILRARIPGQVYTKLDERRRPVQLGRALGHFIGVSKRIDSMTDESKVGHLHSTTYKHLRLSLSNQRGSPILSVRQISSVLNPSAEGRRTPGRTTTS